MHKLRKQEVRVMNAVNNRHRRRYEPLTITGLISLFNETSSAPFLEAILLTPGWAELLGGEYQQDQPITTYLFYYHNRKKHVVVKFIDGYGHMILGEYSVPIPYVHLLQNLFFFITGSELTLKPIDYAM